MAGALVGAATCGRCGADVAGSPQDRICGRCGARRVAASSGSALGSYSGLLTGVQSARPSRRRLAAGIDAAPFVLAAVLILMALSGGFGTDAGVRFAVIAYSALALIAYVGASAVARRRRGRSLGRLLFRLRLVDDLTGAPPRYRSGSGRMRGFSALPPRRDLVVADLVRGRDPLAPGTVPLDPVVLAPATSGRDPDGVALTATAGDRYPDAERSPAVVLVLDTGERLSMETTLLVGRLPVGTADDAHPVFAWPDLSRSLSKTHALLEWTGTVLWVTDLRSTNGSALVAPDGVRQPLVPGLRGPAAPGWTVHLGERRFEVHPSGVLAVVEETGSHDGLLRASPALGRASSEGVRDGR